MTRNLDWAEHPDLVEYYSAHRDKAEDLYPSEARFLPWLAGRTGDVLDVGCGAGGFADVWRHFNPGIRYGGHRHVWSARRLGARAPSRPALRAGRLP